jgi:hypothetical protein
MAKSSDCLSDFCSPRYIIGTIFLQLSDLCRYTTLMSINNNWQLKVRSLPIFKGIVRLLSFFVKYYLKDITT